MITEIGNPVCAGFEPEENICFCKSKFDIGFPQSTAELQMISFSQFELSNRINKYIPRTLFIKIRHSSK